MILAVDPGETTGAAWFTDEGTASAREQVPFNVIEAFLYGLTQGPQPVSKIIIETYTHDPGRQKRGSTFKTVQVIGMLKLFAFIYDAEIVMVGREAKKMGAIYSGEAQPKNHKLSHAVDAYNLGIYHLVTTGVIDAPAMADL